MSPRGRASHVGLLQTFAQQKQHELEENDSPDSLPTHSQKIKNPKRKRVRGASSNDDTPTPSDGSKRQRKRSRKKHLKRKHRKSKGKSKGTSKGKSKKKRLQSHPKAHRVSKRSKYFVVADATGDTRTGYMVFACFGVAWVAC